MIKIKRIGILCFMCFVVLSCAPVVAGESFNTQAGLGTTMQDLSSQLSPGGKDLFSAATGLPQVKDLDLAKIVAYVIFGAVGFAAFMYGKKNAFWRPTIIGLALMIYPYFFSTTFAIYLIGIALTATLYFWRD